MFVIIWVQMQIKLSDFCVGVLSLVNADLLEIRSRTYYWAGFYWFIKTTIKTILWEFRYENYLRVAKIRSLDKTTNDVASSMILPIPLSLKPL